MGECLTPVSSRDVGSPSPGLEDLQHRLTAIREAVNSLHPAVVTVMSFLFRFLYRSVHSGKCCQNWVWACVCV